MNSLKIQYIALSMITLLAGSQMLGMEVKGLVIENTEISTPQGIVPGVLVTPASSGTEGFTTVVPVATAVAPGVYNRATSFVSKKFSRSKDLVAKTGHKALELSSNLKEKTLNLASSVKAHPYKTAGLVGGAAVATAAVVYGVNKYRNNVQLNNAELSREIQQAIASNDFVMANELISKLNVSSKEREAIRNEVNQGIRKQIIVNTMKLVPVKNTVVEEVAQDVKDAAKSVVETSKKVANSVASSVQAALDILSKDLDIAKVEFSNAKRTANMKVVIAKINAMRLKDQVKRALINAYKEVIYSNTVQASTVANQKLATCIKAA